MMNKNDFYHLLISIYICCILLTMLYYAEKALP